MLSAVVLTKNEEENLKGCLSSLNFCDEIIMIDDFSTDGTLAIAKKAKTKIFQRKLNGDFSSQRNFGLKKARGDWVLFVDADERVSKPLREEIERLMRSINKGKSRNVAYYIKRRDFWWGRELRYGETRKVRNKGLIRLVKRNSGQWIGKVHESYMAKGPVGRLRSFLDHFPHPRLKDFISEINFYSSLRAKELFLKGKKTNIIEIVLFPSVKFILNYLLYLGFLDGGPGFVYAFMMSFHSFLVRAKLYQLSLD